MDMEISTENSKLETRNQEESRMENFEPKIVGFCCHY